MSGRGAVLVTGASSGIGREVAIRCAAQGRPVALVARRRAELEKVEVACRSAGGGPLVVATADVADAGQVRAAFDEAEARLGGITSVVHAAGVAAYGRFEEIPAEVFDRVHAVNVGGTANVARESLRRFDQQGIRGDLICFGSVVGRISTPFLSPYTSSKWGVHGLVRCLQGEQAHGGHRISLVEPGGVDTTIYEKAASYLGVQGKPPPPVADAQDVARATVDLLDKPRRERSIGVLNPLMSLGFRIVPGVYDRLVAPLMSRLALDDKPVADHTGNVFEPMDEPSTPADQRKEYA